MAWVLIGSHSSHIASLNVIIYIFLSWCQCTLASCCLSTVIWTCSCSVQILYIHSVYMLNVIGLIWEDRDFPYQTLSLHTEEPVSHLKIIIMLLYCMVPHINHHVSIVFSTTYIYGSTNPCVIYVMWIASYLFPSRNFHLTIFQVLHSYTYIWYSSWWFHYLEYFHWSGFKSYYLVFLIRITQFHSQNFCS